jgi:hypothetical protein
MSRRGQRNPRTLAAVGEYKVATHRIQLVRNVALARVDVSVHDPVTSETLSVWSVPADFFDGTGAVNIITMTTGAETA